MIYAWVLLFAFPASSAVSVSGIASEQACHQLGDAINATRWIPTQYECHRYQAVKP